MNSEPDVCGHSGAVIPQKQSWWGKVITTAESPGGVVRERPFETEAEAKAYAQGVDDGVAEADPECDCVHGAHADFEATELA